MQNLFRILFFILFLTISGIALAKDSGVFGGKILSIESSSNDCIVRDRDNIYINIKSFYSRKKGGLFKKDKGIGLMINSALTVTGDKNQILIPTAFTGSVKNGPSGSIFSVAIGKAIVTNFPLKSTVDSKERKIDAFDITFDIIKHESKTTFGKVTSALVAASDSLPIATKLAPATGLFVSIAEALSADAGNKVPLPEANMVLTFRPTAPSDGNCGDYATTGAKALIFRTKKDDVSKKGIVDIGLLNDYCFYAQDKTNFLVTYNKKAKTSDACVDTPTTTQTNLLNPHVGMLVRALPGDPKAVSINTVKTIDNLNTYTRMYRNAIQLCDDYDLPINECL